MYARESPRSKIIFPKELMKVVMQYDKIMDKTPIHLRLAYINLYAVLRNKRCMRKSAVLRIKYPNFTQMHYRLSFNLLNKEKKI